MKILFMGTPEFAVSSLNGLIKSGHNVCGVVTQPDKPKGRGHKLAPPPVKELAEQSGIRVYQPLTLKGEVFSQELNELNPDMIVVVAYGKILPKYILDFPKYGCINVHASLLPKYRGAGPIQWCIINGETETGITTMHMAEGLDTGDMILKSVTPIGENETAGELHDRLADIGSRLLLETIEKIENNTAVRIAQNDEDSSYAPMISKETGKILWDKSAQEIVNLVRGTNPWPLAFCIYENNKMKVIRTYLGRKNQNGKAGEILGIYNNMIEVLTGDKVTVLIDEIQFEGGKKMSVQSYLNGHEIKVGTIL